MLKDKLELLKDNDNVCEWHIEEEKDVLLYSKEELLMFTTQRRILETFLKAMHKNVLAEEIEEEKKRVLKAFYSRALEQAKVLKGLKGDILKKKIDGDIVLDDSSAED